MHLVSLKLQGFKSFAKTTVLRFSQALTAIVGPNGCGKSNLVDAFRWVLGEPNARALRGEKMQDIIFAGSEKQKPLQFAEVTVTLTDVQGMLPVAYDELAITRRVYRSGESEFRLNDQPVRLKDIQALLWDSGLGRQAFSVFEQGRVDQLLQATPGERRTLFEEIAGISRFKERRKETLRKLEENHTHLERLQDIHKEVAQQVSVLERQAAAARKFHEQKERADHLERGLFYHRHQTLIHKKQTIERQIAQLEEQLQGTSEQQQQQQEELLQAQEALRQAQGAWDTERMTQHQSEQKLEGLKASLRMLQRQRDEGGQRYLRLVADQERVQGRLARIREEWAQLEEQQQSAGEGSSLHEEVLQAAQQRVAREQQQELQQRQVWDRHWQGERSASQRLQELLVEGERLHTEQQRMQERELQLRNRMSHHQEEAAALLQQQVERERQLQESQLQLQQAKEKFHQAERFWKEQRALVEQQSQEWRRLETERASLASQLVLVQQWSKEAQEACQGAQVLLQEAARPESSLSGKISRLVDHVEIFPGTERLLSSALGRANGALLCEDREALTTALEIARARGLTDLVLYAPGEGKLSDSCEALLGEQPILAPLLHGLDLVESTRFLVAAGWVATLDGWVRTPSGLVWCGAGTAGEPLLHEARLRDLSQQQEVAAQRALEAQEKLRLLQHAEAEAEQAKLVSDREVRRLDIRYMELTMALQQVRQREDQITQQQKSLQDDLTRVGEQQHAFHVSHGEKKLEAEQQQERVQELREQLSAQQKLLEEARLQVQHAQEELQSIEREVRTGQLEASRIANRIQMLRAQSEEAQQQQTLTEQRMTEEQQSTHQAEQDASLLLQELERLQHDLVIRQQQMQEQARVLDELRRRAQRQEEALAQGLQHLRQAHTQRQQFDQALVGIRENMDLLSHDYAQRFFSAIQDLDQEVALKEGVSQTEKEVRDLRQQLEQTKDLHLGAIEELEKVGERHQFLSQQLHDVTETEKELQSELQSLEVASRKLFKDAFEEIRGHFQKNFSLLFEGGHADLKLIDSGDILEAGIEIQAQPPGKQTKILQLLSGGERSLTAMALLFAMFENKPAPFCILDEMDAALDDANVERFLRLLERYMGQTQFLLITHNKRTMSAADLLLGVSMQEKGVSTVLALDFAEAEPQLELLEPVS